MYKPLQCVSRLVVAEGEIERLERHQMEIESGLTEEKFAMDMERKRYILNLKQVLRLLDPPLDSAEFIEIC